jgi:hypothetical protein
MNPEVKWRIALEISHYPGINCARELFPANAILWLCF